MEWYASAMMCVELQFQAWLYVICDSHLMWMAKPWPEHAFIIPRWFVYESDIGVEKVHM